jgi:hypothetical protein
VAPFGELAVQCDKQEVHAEEQMGVAVPLVLTDWLE